MATDQSVETSWSQTADRAQLSKPAGLKNILEEHERGLILAALQTSHGNKAKAARALGITERLMGIRVKRLGIDWRSLRPGRSGRPTTG